MLSYTFLVFWQICDFIMFIFLLIKCQISVKEYQPIRKRNWWSEIVSGTVCLIAVTLFSLLLKDSMGQLSLLRAMSLFIEKRGHTFITSTSTKNYQFSDPASHPQK